MINKSATAAGTAVMKSTGITASLWIDSNRNTGAPILWVSLNGAKARRLTGKNIRQFLEGFDDDLNEGLATWIVRPSEAVFDALIAMRGN